MPNASAKFSSEYLTAEQMASLLSALPEVLLELFGECLFTASYGWASKIHGDLWHKPMRVSTSHLKWLIEDSIDQKILVPGGTDFHVNSPAEELEVLFCHESDIHIDGKDLEKMQQFMSAKEFSEIKWLTQEEVKEQIDNWNQ